MSERLMLLDSASTYFRACFGVPDVRAPDGTPVNAVRGFLDAIARLVTEFAPTEVVACWDGDWRPAWRVVLLLSCKAQRVVVSEVSAGVAGTPGPSGPTRTPGTPGVPPPSAQPWPIERKCPTTSPVRSRSSRRGSRCWTFPYADFAVLRGDASDGLPGVGDKTAATLIRGWDSLAALRVVRDDPASSLGLALCACLVVAAVYLDIVLQVVYIVRDVPLAARSASSPSRTSGPDSRLDLDALAACGAQ